MRSAIIENGIVQNITLGEMDGGVECPDFVGIGWLFDGEVYSSPPLSDEENANISGAAIKALRTERDRLLAATDWIILRNLETSEPVPQEWLTYRQELRDLPDTTIDPLNVEWPKEPAT